MKKCLVTGGKGHIGSHLMKSLTQDYEVYSVTRPGSPISRNTAAVQYIPIDFSQPWDMEQLPNEPIDTLIHLAQSENFRDFPESALPVFQVNTLSTVKLLDYARRNGVRTFVLASTGGVYKPGHQPCSENADISIQRDLGFYINTKLCSELLVESYSPYLNIIILRFFFVYGPGQRSNMLIPRLVQSVVDDKPIVLHGENGLQLNPTHVSDAITSIRQSLLLEEPHIINVGGPEVYSLRQIGEIIGHELGREPKFVVHEEILPKDLIANISRMTELLGAPKVRFPEGIQSYIQEASPQPGTVLAKN